MNDSSPFFVGSFKKKNMMINATAARITFNQKSQCQEA